MARKRDDDPVDETITIPSPTFNTFAYSVFKNLEKKKWTVIKYPIDSVTLDVGSGEIVGEFDDKTSAVETFKINVAKEVFTKEFRENT